VTHAAVDGIVVGTGAVVAVALVAVGARGVIARVKALRARVRTYGELPVLTYARRTVVKMNGASYRAERAPALVYRARAALHEIANAFTKLQAIVTSPASIWRLGELLVTGK